MKRFKGKFKVTENGIIGRIIWYGKETVGVEYYNNNETFYWSGEVYKETIIGNLKYGNYKPI